jgi:hypothetical protein
MRAVAKKKKSSKSKGKKRVEIHYVGAPPGDKGILAGAKKLLPDDASEQFLVGLLIGAGAAYALSDGRLRRQIIRYAMRTYDNAVGGFEELKEEVADIQAEIRAEQAAGS